MNKYTISRQAHKAGRRTWYTVTITSNGHSHTLVAAGAQGHLSGIQLLGHPAELYWQGVCATLSVTFNSTAWHIFAKELSAVINAK